MVNHHKLLSGASRRTLTLVTVVVALLVPPLLVTTSLRVVTNDWIVRFEYASGTVAEDRYGLTRSERTELALVGLDTIRPGTRGVALLREARLPDGAPAFNEREVAHMQDVRDLVGSLLAFQLWGTVALATLAVALGLSRRTRAIVPRGLRWGVASSVGVAAVVGLVMLAAWDWFFVRFHGVFFPPDTWRFPTGDTLIRLYPDTFWMGVGAWIAGLTVALAGLVWLGSALWLRRTGAQTPAA